MDLLDSVSVIDVRLLALKKRKLYENACNKEERIIEEINDQGAANNTIHAERNAI